MDSNAMKAKYPRYTREENLACKLTDQEISEIRKKRALGLTLKELARQYNVSTTPILYWTSETFRQKNIEDSSKRLRENTTPEIRVERDYRYKKRKRLLQYRKMREYDISHRNKKTDRNYSRAVWAFIRENKKDFDEFRKQFNQRQKKKMAKTKASRTTTNTKRISNPVTGTYYQLRVRNTSAGKRGTIMGKWRPPAKSSKKISL